MHIENVAVNSLSTVGRDNYSSVQQKATLQKTHDQLSHPEQLINKDKINTVVSKLNNFIEQPVRTNLQFKLHEELNEYYVTVVNPLTNEVIKEIPPKKILDMYAAMAEFMGILVDKKI